MQLSISFIRILFLSLCLLFSTTYSLANPLHTDLTISLILSTAAAAAFWGLMISADIFLKKINLRAFNTATLGILFGYLMGESIMIIFKTVLEAAPSQLSSSAELLIRMSVFLFSIYIGMIMTARSSDEISLSIPFFKFKPTSQKKKDLLIDSAALADPRIIDLAMSGLLDQNIVLPRFLIKECNEQIESADEALRSKARKCIDNVKKLETIPSLEMRYAETDYNDVRDSVVKLLRIARLLDANILTADANKLQQPLLEGIRLINIHHLSTTLKPVAQTGEFINIKIQRYGKEPRQGIGYLDDGTMVVVNGGAEFIGETIRAQVLSAKHTSSGRMIFCNALEDSMYADSGLAPLACAEADTSAKNYFVTN